MSRPWVPKRLGFAPSTPMIWSSYDTDCEIEIDPSVLDRPVELVKDIAMPEREPQRVLATIGTKLSSVTSLDSLLQSLSTKIALQERMLQAELKAKVEHSSLPQHQKTRILAESQSLIARGPGQVEQIPIDASTRILPDLVVPEYAPESPHELEQSENATNSGPKAAPPRRAALPSRPIVKQSSRVPKKSASAAAARSSFSFVSSTSQVTTPSNAVDGQPVEVEEEEVVGVIDVASPKPSTNVEDADADIDMADYVMDVDDRDEDDNWNEYIGTGKRDEDAPAIDDDDDDYY